MQGRTVNSRVFYAPHCDINAGEPENILCRPRLQIASAMPFIIMCQLLAVFGVLTRR